MLSITKSHEMNVSDHRSNSYEQIEFAVKKIGKSKDRRKVFEFIYFGKKPVKTVPEISQATGLSSKRVLEEGRTLSNNGIVTQLKLDKKTAYQKDPFFSSHKNQILNLVANPTNLKKLPSKRNTNIKASFENIRLPKQLVKVKKIYLEDIDSFKRTRNKKQLVQVDISKISEKKFKDGVKKIIGEKGTFTDWGGEKNDLLSSRVIYNGRRIATAFAFKGPGKKGKLTPAKMGKNGDQIQRLFNTSGDLFILQYWHQIDDSVHEQMEAFAKLKSISDMKTILYSVLDGADSEKLVSAYPLYFI